LRSLAEGEPVFEQTRPGAQSSRPTFSGAVPVRVHTAPSVTDPVAAMHAVRPGVFATGAMTVHFAPGPHVSCFVTSQHVERTSGKSMRVIFTSHVAPDSAHDIETSRSDGTVPEQCSSVSDDPSIVPTSGGGERSTPGACEWTETEHPVCETHE
jgi:hypothetical protein